MYHQRMKIPASPAAPALLLTCFLLVSCATTPQTEDTVPEEPEIPYNELLVQAGQKVEAVIQMEAQWQVRDPLTHNQSVNLGDLLIIAQEKYHNGEIDEANRLAQKISETADSALSQAESNKNSLPLYNIIIDSNHD